MPPITRNDVSDWVVHLTKLDEPQRFETADERRDRRNKPFRTLLTILEERCLLAGHGFIVDNIDCVCFTETTIETLKEIFDKGHERFRYQPFGIMVPKGVAYLAGARPVIYQPRCDLSLLHPSKRHLHVTFDLIQSIDFTWEREWRLRMDQFGLIPDIVQVVVPTAGVRDLVRGWLAHKGLPDPWTFVILEHLGVDAPVDPSALPPIP